MIHTCWKPVSLAFLRSATYGHGSVKSVASSVGEGAIAVQFVHQHLSTV